MSDLKQRLIRSYVQRDAVQFDVILEELFAAHPPLAELAGAIAAAIINVLQHQIGPLAVNAHELVQGITAHLAPLYAELERLKAENTRLLNDLAMAEYFAREAEYESHASESRAEASVHRGLLARIDREIGGGDGKSL